ncbi:hypothetical protein IF1G_08435 [Cordyceps javanica]|uniref:Uncharacterized protein n=1 Tax=Cordyceps javanica TaxID=43265 RepID=A0A545UUJ6_9HYPO|nr:hypothetical protein IF1G_08435 [Cordyceps javanica]TQW05032.1 hypothetical protein IF2G_07675 [Cordyceps javanica]
MLVKLYSPRAIFPSRQCVQTLLSCRISGFVTAYINNPSIFVRHVLLLVYMLIRAMRPDVLAPEPACWAISNDDCAHSLFQYRM